LPDRKLDADAMDVKLDKGVLKVTIPKKDSSEVVRAISVCLRRFRPRAVRSEQMALCGPLEINWKIGIKLALATQLLCCGNVAQSP
jgi:hypothetical protein